LTRRPYLFWPLLGGALALCLLTNVHTGTSAPAHAALPAQIPTLASLRLDASDTLPMPAGVPSAHASHLHPLSDRHSASIAAVWFAGERESAPDVRIAFSRFDRTTQQWTPAQIIAERQAVGRQLGHGVRRFGNPVLWMDSRDRLHLFVVATGLGGWAAARILHLEQQGDPYALDELRFAPRRILPLSWLWNTSHLVRSAPQPLIDGGVALPVYFELGAKYPLLAYLNADSELTGLSRISQRRNLLQPTIVPVDGQHWFAYMRMTGGSQRVAAAETRDAGLSWQDLPDLELPNPNAAVAGLGIGGRQLLAFNPDTRSRTALALDISADGRRWSRVADLEQGNAGDEFSYPAMAWADGSLWVSYTHQRQRIAWQRFSAVAP
jgi:predicted neuraminidase